MSRLAGRMPKGLGQRLTAPVGTGAGAAARRSTCLSLRTAPARFASAENNSNKPRPSGHSFQGQLTHSIMKRLQRERADLERMARTRPDPLLRRLRFMAAGLPVPARRRPQLDATPERNTTAELQSQTQPTWRLPGPTSSRSSARRTSARSRTTSSSTPPRTGSSHQSDPAHKPFCVVYPSTTEQVARLMKICHVRRIPVVGYSGGTSLEGHYTPTRGGICVDFSRMDKVLALHKEDLDVVVQPGVGWEALNEQLAEHNLFFPPDPGPGAQIGGMIGTGCSGTNAYRYGTMREWVLSLTVVLADGTVIKTRQRPRKSSAGYDLTRLFIGSEGTLGLVTEATLKLCVTPAAASVAVASFPSIRNAADCVARVVGDGVTVAAVEILDDDQMRFINALGNTTRKWREAPTLFFKFSGSPAAVKEQVDLVRAMAKRAGGQSFDFARDENEQAELWSARKDALWATMGQRRPGDHVWTGDVAVPMSRLPDIIEETKKDLKTTGLTSSIVGHVGDGNFHIILLYNEVERKLAEDCVHRMVKRAVEMEGTVTGEHGVGLVKRDYLPHELGETTVDAMRKIKAAFDPLCLLNCDKVVRVQKPARGEVAKW
ncbi:hypothetical protein CHGG_01925 [Chaetomium globosum CBS 148.51]|uniref:D-lactate dehydrogenase (cytochrome) n=1 Tax=Chaetomium globosum (strain ATCC 6205 / CBS 148.51 / DSM 1962 / NBRC 6347 / NRRL 1970) TaxID=306901 RepID=Q2HCX9_CHAGB|nr:uncharacterized protein CHGG_01925 [Chaetomium globosum CBS 148.51]EAQ93690.1 hypothetical protein CHGG_01925 [Chaetomium globosum CBS 148.51]